MKHYPQFDVLRGVAAIWVFLSHLLMISGIYIPVVSAGDHAVDLFVILSGFVITLLVNKKHEPYSAYIFRRWVRLYPLFILALILGSLSSVYYGPVLGQNPFLPPSELFKLRKTAELEYFWQHLLAHLTMLHGAVPDTILPQSAFAFSGPLWSISLEWQFYLVAPFVIWALDFNRQSWWIVVVTLVTMVLGRVVATQYWPIISVPAFLPLRLELFALGICSALVWEKAKLHEFKTLIVTAILVITLYIKFLNGHLAPLLMWFSVFILALLGDKYSFSRICNTLIKNKLAIWIGTRSYGLYVLHMPIVLFISYNFVLPHAESFKRSGTFLALLVTSLPVILVAITLCYKYIEQPTIEWGRKVANRFY